MLKRMTARKFLTPLLLSVLGLLPVPAGDSPAKEHARIEVSGNADPIAPGATARLSVLVVPFEGVKINRYPKIQVTVAEVEGLVAATTASLGNPKPAPIDNQESGYFKDPEPVELELQLQAAAPVGPTEIDAEVKYYYCVAASGYCAPAKADLKIPVSVKKVGT